MNISLYELFRTPVQVRILEELLKKPNEYFTINKMAKILSVSPSSVSSRVDFLEKIGIIRVISSEKAKVFTLNKENRISLLLLDFFKNLRNIQSSW